RGAFVEAYDVRADGVEQTFLLRDRPAVAGDLVLRGSVATDLVATPRAAVHGEILFRDRAGRPILTYGASPAIDAVGHRFAMTTGWDGSNVELRLPAAAIEAAVFPLLVDPLTATVPVDVGGPGAGALRDIAVHRNTTMNSRALLTLYSRTNAQNDVDMFAVLGDDAQGGQIAIFQDLSTSWSSQRGAVTFVGAASRWLVAFEREFSTSAAVRYFAVHEAATTPVFTVLTVPHPNGYSCSRRPDVGGTLATSTTGTRGLIAFQCDATTSKQDTDHTEIFACTVDLAQPQLPLSQPFVAGSSVGTRYDRTAVTVNRESEGGNSSWIVGYQQFDRNNPNASWRVGLVRVTPNGSRYGPSLAFLNSGHALTPRVAGLGGRYLVVHSRRAGSGTATTEEFGTTVNCMRFDWSDTAPNPTFSPARTIDLGFTWDYRVAGAAIDTDSRSHWAFVVEKEPTIGTPALGIVRVGGSGGAVEELDLYRSSTRPGYAPAICFDDAHDEFDTAFAVDTPSSGVYARSLRYPSDAAALPFGTACGGEIAANHVPRVGDHLFAIGLEGAAPQQGALIVLSLSSSQTPLAFAGMPGCTLLADINNGMIGTYFTLTRSDGTASFPIVLGDWPPLPLDFTAQWFHLQPNANAAGMLATRGLEVRVR
ncbi:MAG: hypothetical protein KDE27_29410, partial [Planctomycetes bacterium]|nr:hypothetical protein [Planctomycetota bacterium]